VRGSVKTGERLGKKEMEAQAHNNITNFKRALGFVWAGPILHPVLEKKTSQQGNRCLVWTPGPGPPGCCCGC
jgi:hypothetical protein